MASVVPYTGELEVSPQVNPLSAVHEDVPVAAFGGAVAGAISHLGETVQGAGKELFQRAYGFQEMDQQVKADGVVADIMDKSTQLYLDLDQKKGAERTAALPKFQADLRQLRQDGVDSVDSPYAKLRVLSESRRNEAQMTWHGAVLARQGQDQAEKVNNEALRSASINKFAKTDPDDPTALKTAVEELKAANQNETHRLGGPLPGTPEAEAASAQAMSKDYSKLVIAARNSSNPARAKQLIEQGKANGLLTPEDAMQLEGPVESTINGKLGNKIANIVNADPKNKDLDVKQRVEKAKALAEQMDPGNDELKMHAGIQTETGVAHQENLDNAAWRHTQKTLLGGIDGSTTQDGKVPLSLEEAEQDPVWRETYRGLPEDQRGPVLEQILANQKTNGYKTNEKGTAEFNQLHDALFNPNATPKEIDDALNANLLTLHMDKTQRAVIQKQQEAILKSQSSEPHVTQALKAPKVVDAIKAAGLKPGTDAYREFTTEFTTAIKQYAEGGHRKVEDPEVLGRIANDMVFTKYAYHLYDPRTWHQTQMRDNIFAVNKGIKEQFQQIWKQEHGDFPTDAQLNTMAPEAYKTYFKLLGAASRPATGKNTTQAPSSTRPAP